MQTELNLPSISERISSYSPIFTVKCLHSLQIVPHYSQVIRTSLDPRSHLPSLQPGGRTLVKTVCSILRGQNVVVFQEEEIVPRPPPWMLPIPHVCYTPTWKTAPPSLQRQLALETIASVQASHHLYTDGSLLSDGKAGSAVFSLDTDPPLGGWMGRKLPNSSSSTFCELYGVLDAVNLLCQRGFSGVVICDSKSALQAFSSSKPAYRSLVQRILSFLALMGEIGITVQFLWISSHIGIRCIDMVNSLAKTAYDLPAGGLVPSPSLSCSLKKVRVAALLNISNCRDQRRPAGVSIHHNDAFRHHRYKYRWGGLMVRRHNVVSPRLRLGYSVSV
ncbi:hypothetical protein E2C01_089050 [Portunus trituberculatus]|uniref:RNase H type-1 domain-containing protein n=1 Tax=Portunus trituberculatus TaxID=210409 RepID=A0A5B7JNI9_PORTR|nr:hypothetical protein [Portunus trituberculatus]